LDLDLGAALVESLDQIGVGFLHLGRGDHNDAVGIDISGDGGVGAFDGEHGGAGGAVFGGWGGGG